MRNFLTFIPADEISARVPAVREWLARSWEVSSIEETEYSFTFFCRNLTKKISIYVEMGQIEGEANCLVMVLPAGFALFGKKKRAAEVDCVADAIEESLRGDARVSMVKRYTPDEFDASQRHSSTRI